MSRRSNRFVGEPIGSSRRLPHQEFDGSDSFFRVPSSVPVPSVYRPRSGPVVFNPPVGRVVQRLGRVVPNMRLTAIHAPDLKRAVICARRKARKESLFAKGIAGRRGIGRGGARRKAQSKVRC